MHCGVHNTAEVWRLYDKRKQIRIRLFLRDLFEQAIGKSRNHALIYNSGHFLVGFLQHLNRAHLSGYRLYSGAFLGVPEQTPYGCLMTM